MNMFSFVFDRAMRPFIVDWTRSLGR